MRRLSSLIAAAAGLAVLAIMAPAPAATASPLAVAPARAVPASLARFYAQDLAWRDCYWMAQCARLRVPLSYADPSGPSATVAVLRVRATDTDRRLGSLVINPGGPGASGVDYALSAAYSLSGSITSRYDIVGFDSRGVDRTMPTRCLTDAITDRWLWADFTPDTAAERQRVSAIARRIADRCRALYPDTLAHVGTRDTARDMDILRAALGDTRLNFLGYSYGTYLGAHYAQRFPDRVGRLVLDGVVNPAYDGVEGSRAQLGGFQLAIRRFVRDCLARAECPLTGTPAEAMAQLEQWLRGLDRQPLRTTGDSPLRESHAIYAIVGSMYSAPDSWGSLRRALAEALAGDGTSMLEIAYWFADRSDGHYPSTMQASFISIGCLDSPRTPGPAGLRDLAREFAATSAKQGGLPSLGRAFAWLMLPCSYWPVHAAQRPAPITAPGAAPILVVGTTYDPATPYASARTLARTLESGVLLTWVGDGHVAYTRGSGCIDRAVNAYLLTGRTPAPGTVCRD